VRILIRLRSEFSRIPLRRSLAGYFA